MLDIKLFRENTDELKAKLAKKKADLSDVDKVTELDIKRREITFKNEQLKSKQNSVSKEIPSLRPTQTARNSKVAPSINPRRPPPTVLSRNSTPSTSLDSSSLASSGRTCSYFVVFVLFPAVMCPSI